MYERKTHPISGRCLFLSDVHLGGFSPSRNESLEKELINLIDYAEENEYQLFVLGDLFDYWMEYPDHIPGLGREVLMRFKAYNRSFGPTLYITGNHDSWTNGYFSETGFDVERDFRILELPGKNVLLLHGDGLADGAFDYPRPLLHRLLRNSAFVSTYQTLFPPRAGLNIMKQFSKINRLLRQNYTIAPELDRWAEETLEESDLDGIICGHDHQPRVRNFSFGTYLNLGTFYKHRTLAAYNNDEFNLVVWSDEKQQLTNADFTPVTYEQ